jgi:UPF0716 protein FxsA
MFGRIVLLSVLSLPLIEIALFIVIGQAIGLLPTLLGVILSALIGALVLRWQGTATLRELQSRLQRGQIPGRAMADTMLIGLSGLLLLLPGYFTDLLGLLLLVPWTRGLIHRSLARRLRVVEVTTRHGPLDEPRLVDLGRNDWRDGSSL